MIKMFLHGRLTADPQTSEKGFVNLRMVANSSKTKDGQPIPEFFSVTVWGKRGDACATYLKKGDSVIVSGDFSSATYIGRDSKEHIALNVDSATVDFGARAQSNMNRDEREGAYAGNRNSSRNSYENSDDTDNDDELFQ